MVYPFPKVSSRGTALLRVYNDIIATIGRGNGVMLVLLDLSAGFDTINIGIGSSLRCWGRVD